MDKYIIVKLVFGDTMLAEVRDILLEDFEETSQKIVALANEVGSKAYLFDSTNDIATSDSFAMVEHNFPLTQEFKTKLVDLLSNFFKDGDLEYDGFSLYDTLKAVRFLQTDGELFVL